MAEKYKVDGLKELSATLSGLSLQLEKNVILGALRAAGQVIRKEAMRRVPVYQGNDKRRIPGFIRKSISVRRSKGRLAVYVGVYVDKKQVKIEQEQGRKTIINKRGREQVVKTASKRDWSNPLDASYWKMIEFGSKNQHATPFLRGSFEAKKFEAVQKFQEYLGKRLEKEAKKLAAQKGLKAA